jgi:ubiquinone/menaquinone biosynthesis C-methylase UbiE
VDSTAWDERYRTAEFVWKTDPNQFLPAEVAEMTPGAVLDLACGEGRNAVWLATQGWTATGVDFSEAGLAKAARLAESNGVAATWIRADGTNWTPDQQYDLVIIFYLQIPDQERSDAIGMAARALAPGGTLLLVGHDLTNLSEGVGGPQDPSVLYTPDDIQDDLARSGVTDLVVERAERVERAVEVGSETRNAIDCLVRARREAPSNDPRRMTT